MRSRTSAHDQAVARRLEQLSAELAGERPRPDLGRGDDFHDGFTRVRPAVARPAPDAGGDEPGGDGPGEAVPVPVPGRHAARRRGSGLLPAAWLERAGVGGAALGPGPVAVVAVLAALGLALACWWLLRGQPEPVQLETTSVGSLATPVASGASSHDHAGAQADAEVVVDVAGKVRRPGIVVLEPGSRVVDALEQAGGVRRGVDLTGLNLARVLVDGEQVLVGVPATAGAARPAVPGAGTAAGAGGLLNLNTATSEQLQELPGVGPVTAEAILAFRTDHGPFTRVEELLDVKGIGEATLDELALHVTV